MNSPRLAATIHRPLCDIRVEHYGLHTCPARSIVYGGKEGAAPGEAAPGVRGGKKSRRSYSILDERVIRKATEKSSYYYNYYN